MPRITPFHLFKKIIAADNLKTNAIQLEIAIPFGYIPRGLATDATGVAFESKQYLLSSELLKHVKAAYFETDLQELSDGAVDVELYDYDAGSVIAKVSLSATTKRSRVDVDTSKLVSGHALGVRFNVTTAGASGSTGGGCSPVLILVLGVS